MPRVPKTTVELLEDEANIQRYKITYLEGRYELTGSRSTDRCLRKHRLILWALERTISDLKAKERDAERRWR